MLEAARGMRAVALFEEFSRRHPETGMGVRWTSPVENLALDLEADAQEDLYPSSLLILVKSVVVRHDMQSLGPTWDIAMKSRLIALVSLFAVLGASAAPAQMTVDVAKITCRQLLFDKIIGTRTKSIALWLSGYYHGKQGNTLVDIGTIEKNRDKVEDYCRLNQELTVMDAIEKTLGSDK